MRYSTDVFVITFLAMVSIAIIESPPVSLVNRRQFHFGHLSLPRGWIRQCTEDDECGHGYCRAHFSRCFRGYMTRHYMHVCEYNQREKSTAFLLSFFVGQFGVHWFYLSRGNSKYIIVGVFKILSLCGCVCIYPFVFVRIGENDTVMPALGYIIAVLITLTSSVWWLVDWTRILTDVFLDGNGASLLPF